MYKDKEQQREAARMAKERYKAKQQGIPVSGIPQGIPQQGIPEDIMHGYVSQLDMQYGVIHNEIPLSTYLKAYPRIV